MREKTIQYTLHSEIVHKKCDFFSSQQTVIIVTAQIVKQAVLAPFDTFQPCFTNELTNNICSFRYFDCADRKHEFKENWTETFKSICTNSWANQLGHTQLKHDLSSFLCLKHYRFYCDEPTKFHGDWNSIYLSRIRIWFLTKRSYLLSCRLVSHLQHRNFISQSTSHRIQRNISILWASRLGVCVCTLIHTQTGTLS